MNIVLLIYSEPQRFTPYRPGHKFSSEVCLASTSSYSPKIKVDGKTVGYKKSGKHFHKGLNLDAPF